MNHSTRVIRKPRRAWPPTARTAAAVIAAAGLALLPAIHGSPSSTGPGGLAYAAGSPNVQKLLAFSRCMRSHGVSNWPDPNSSGQFPKRRLEHLGVSNSGLQAAQTACRHLLPNGGNGPTPAQLAQSWSDFLKFARCMRSHGVRNWPDPTRYAPHPERPYFNLSAAGINPSAPQIVTKIHQCLYLLHGNNPQRLGGS